MEAVKVRSVANCSLILRPLPLLVFMTAKSTMKIAKGRGLTFMHVYMIIFMFIFRHRNLFCCQLVHCSMGYS